MFRISRINAFSVALPPRQGFAAYKVKVATNDPGIDLRPAEEHGKAVGDHARVSADAKHVNLAGKAADSSIGSAAIAHLAPALPQLDRDCNITGPYLADDIVESPVAVVDSQIVTPEGPCLGVAVDEDKLARYRNG